MAVVRRLRILNALRDPQVSLIPLLLALITIDSIMMRLRIPSILRSCKLRIAHLRTRTCRRPQISFPLHTQVIHLIIPYGTHHFAHKQETWAIVGHHYCDYHAGSMRPKFLGLSLHRGVAGPMAHPRATC